MRGILLSLILAVSMTANAGPSHRHHKEGILKELISSNQQSRQKQQTCLARAIYFEASHLKNSQIAVGNTIVNRVVSRNYPDTVCDVVHQKTTTRSGKQICQFSYLCEEEKQVVEGSSKWKNAQQTAVNILNSFFSRTRKDPTDGATHFHDIRVYPKWAQSDNFEQTMKTERLTFYKTKGN